MTGAPKIKSVQLLSSLEDNVPRGVYSGCLGFLDLGKQGNSEFSVVIRTIVWNGKREPSCYLIGAGGAVVMLSDAVSEESEMRLKAQSVLPTLMSFLESDH